MTKESEMNRIAGPAERQQVTIPLAAGEIEGHLTLPSSAHALVLFAHGSGSSRLSPRNRFVAHVLNEARLGTLLLDLLTPSEELIDEQTAELRFNIDLLAARLIAASRWLRQNDQPAGLKLGYFGASTGAAAALEAAAELQDDVGAIVSRGGRPDLAASYLARVRAPTLLIVGGKDALVLDLNRRALDALKVEKRMEIVPGATHLFEEPGALERVALLARDWFQHYLGA